MPTSLGRGEFQHQRLPSLKGSSRDWGSVATMNPYCQRAEEHIRVRLLDDLSLANVERKPHRFLSDSENDNILEIA